MHPVLFHRETYYFVLPIPSLLSPSRYVFVILFGQVFLIKRRSLIPLIPRRIEESFGSIRILANTQQAFNAHINAEFSSASSTEYRLFNYFIHRSSCVFVLQ